MHCPACAFDNPPAMKFCGECGGALPSACPGCGTGNPPGFRFCGQCGHALTGAQPPSNRPSVPALRREEERRQLTVMFCDLVDSTPLAEALDPEEYMDVVRAYQAEVDREVKRWNGHIAQYLGDGVLVYFGYPRAAEDDAYRAVQAGLAVVAAITELGAEMARRHGAKVRVRVGMHTGLVIAGSIGGPERNDKLALGSTPNIAARLQSLAAPETVVISAATHALVRRHIVAESLGEHSLKGIAEPMEVFLATNRRAEEESSGGVFIGRKHDLAVLRREFDAVREGGTRWVIVRGEAGIGKSRLISEFKRNTRDAQWLTLRCSAYHENVDLYPLAEMLKRRIGLSDDAHADRRLTELDRWLSLESMDSMEHREQLAAVLDVASPNESRVAINRKTGFRVIADWLRKAARKEPIVLAMEDAHWSDPSTLDFFRFLILAIEDANVLVVITGRPGFDPPWAPPEHQVLLEMSRIAESDALEFVRSQWDGNLPSDVMHQIVERADGVPLFIEELVRACKHSRTGVDLEHFVPVSLQDALMARIDALGEAKEVAQVGALLGRSFGMAMLEAAIPKDRSRLQDWVARVVDSGLIQRIGSGQRATLRFRHALIQDTAYTSLLRSRRREIHARIADTIISSFRDLVDAEPQTLARHLEGAERIVEAVEAYAGAGTKASGRRAYVESLRCFRRSHELLMSLPDNASRASKEFELLSAMAGPLQATEGYGSDGRRALIDRMSELRANHPEIGTHFDVVFDEWGYHTMRGHRAQSLDFGASALMLAEETGEPRQLVAGHFAVGSNCFYGGAFEQAQSHLAKAISLTENQSVPNRRDNSAPGFLARLVQGWCFSLLGYPDRSLALLESTLSGSRKDLGAFGQVQTLTWLCYCDMDMRRDARLILERAESAITLCKEHGMLSWSDSAQVIKRWALYLLGEDRRLEEGIEQFKLRADNTVVTSGYSIVRTIDALLSRDRLDLCHKLIEFASQLGETNLGTFFLPELYRVRGIVDVREGRKDRGRQAFEQGIALARACASRTQELRTHVDLSEHLPDAAAAHRERFVALFDGFTEGRDEPLLREAARYRAV